MTTCKAEAIESYTFKSSDELLLDANIWLFILGPQNPRNNRKSVTVYSQALKKIFEAKSRIFIDVLIISEFINRYAKSGAEAHPEYSNFGNFKRFRNSEHFKPIAQDIASEMGVTSF